MLKTNLRTIKATIQWECCKKKIKNKKYKI